MADRKCLEVWLCPILLVGTCLVLSVSSATLDDKTGPQTSNEEWGYVNVRPSAHMFWWLYKAPEFSSSPTMFPLILWLQGGPGASSTGFGNFQEIGPLDLNLKPRNTTWLSAASLLFVDNPVGTGYSYVTDKDAYARNVTEAATDLVTLLGAFFTSQTDLQKAPFYIFSESYGGKLAAVSAKILLKAVQQGEVKCNLMGVALGDSWISPMDYVNNWGPYLRATSLLDFGGLQAVQKSAQETKKAVDEGHWTKATELWGQTEYVVMKNTHGVNFYNILRVPLSGSRASTSNTPAIKMLYRRHVAPLHAPSLAELMNGPIRKKLAVIPDNVTWGAHAKDVFGMMAGDFMKPVINIVDELLLIKDLKVVVYNGQLDLICNSLGTEAWVQKLDWSGLKEFNSKKWTPMISTNESKTIAFMKTEGSFSFYWILNAGHMVPADAGETAVTMLKKVLEG